MSGLSKVIVFDPDIRASRQVQLGFEREGIPTQVVTPIPIDATKMTLPDDDAGLVVVGGTDGRALDLLRRARKIVDDANIDVPILFAGRGIRRTDAETAGADEVVLQPAYLRDVVTVGRLLRGQGRGREQISGSLAETTGVYTLVRALATIGRSAVLTLIRGLRRGEVRFFHGEVTSAQVGLIHGQAALHQLMLWTDARFEFHHEDVVRRHQIPLAHEELFADAERFLAGIRDSSGRLSPSMILEQDVARIHSLGKQVPTEVHGVLRMFDGHRVLADVLEDSPYRVFETLRVAQRALDAGLLRIAASPRGKKATWRAVLAIEEWLVGSDTRDEVIERVTADSSQAVEMPAKRSRRRERRKTPVELPQVAKADIDWGTLVPRIVGAEVGSLAGVVPAAHMSGEISLPAATREEPREGLELMDPEKRDQMFPSDSAGTEPSVVWDERRENEEKPRVDPDRIKAEADEMARRVAEARRAKADAEVRDQNVKDVAGGRVLAETQARANAEAQEQARAEAERQARVDAEAARVAADAERRARAREEAAAYAAAKVEEELLKQKLDAEARQRELAEQAEREALARKEAEARAPQAEREAQTRRDAEARVVADPKKQARLEADARALAARARAASDAKRAATPATNAAESSGGIPQAKAPRRDSKKNRAARRAEKRLESARSSKNAIDLVQQIVKADPETAHVTTSPVIVAETPHATVTLAEQMTITTTEQTARVVAVPLATVTSARPHDGIPEASDIETSDGVIREDLSTAETPPQPRYHPPPGESPPDDRPDDMTGEIDSAVTNRHLKLPLEPPASSEPSILVADIAAVHSQISMVAVAQAAAPRTVDASTPAQEEAVAKVQKDATKGFTQIEEEFFRAGQTEDAKQPAVNVESFDDLDEGYQRVGFWDRLLGRKPPK
ncbi:MAG TPA: DUF4388 domain-containing protein [Kofleriaceae bacterium]